MVYLVSEASKPSHLFINNSLKTPNPILYCTKAVDSIVHDKLRPSKSQNSQSSISSTIISYKEKAFDMSLNIYSNASYLSAHDGKSRVGGHFFQGWMPHNDHPIKMNGTTHIIAIILKYIAALATEAELGIYLSMRKMVLKEIGHRRPPISIHCDNSTAASCLHCLQHHQTGKLRING